MNAPTHANGPPCRGGRLPKAGVDVLTPPAYEIVNRSRRRVRLDGVALMAESNSTPDRVTVSEEESVATALTQTPEGRSHPYPLYHRLRDLAPVHRSEVAGGWLLSRYDDCKAILKDPRFEKRYEQSMDTRSSRWRDRPALVWAGRSLLNLDGGVHARLRRQVFRSFTKGSVDRLRPFVEQLTDRLLDEMDATGGGDLMNGLSFRLPIAVIGRMLGVPENDLTSFRDLTVALTAAFELNSTKEMRDAADAAAVRCIAYFDQLIAAKRAQPADDLISELARSSDAGSDSPTDDEINNLSMLLFFAGFETTSNVIGNGVLALLDQPDQISLLHRDPSLYHNLASEVLRHSGTVQLVSRFSIADVEVEGVLIPAGEAVFPLLGAANRDPARFDDPDRLDLTRTECHPLAFGGGVHRCLGAALAEMEIEIVFQKLLSRFDISELEEVRPPHRDRLVIRAPSEVPIRLGRRPVSVPQGADIAARPLDSDVAWRESYRAAQESQAVPLDPTRIAERVALLKHVPLFAIFDPSALTTVAATAYEMPFDPGDVLCLQGAEARECYVIAEGEARVSIDGVDIAVVGADDVIGERGPILDEHRSATVTATTNMITLAISRDRLRQLMRSDPAAEAAMKAAVAARYSTLPTHRSGV